MSDPFISEIQMFAGNFAPRGWSFCSGQILPISQNTALFSLLNNTYGGDARTTFGLPDLRGRVPMQRGHGPGLTPRPLGVRLGVEYVTLTASEMPSHDHVQQAAAAAADQATPAGHVPAQGMTGASAVQMYIADGVPGQMAGDALGTAGGGQSHDNVMPVLAIAFIISLFGVYPSRS